MKLYEIIFSPTGGTKRAADFLAAAWECEKEEIDLLSPKEDGSGYSFTCEDICIFAVPAFGGRVPGPVMEKLKKMKGNNACAVLMAVYGNREFEDTLLELKDGAEAAGFSVFAAAAAVAEHSIVRKFAAGRPDEKDREELKEFGRQIQAALMAGGEKERAPLQVPGNRPYRKYGGVPLKPEGGKNCMDCSTCAEECPTGAIPRENPRTVNKDLCISCMHCIAVCPKKARGNNKLLVFGTEQKLKEVCSKRKENQLYL
ncbi:4Fe-4S binding protein [Lachnospiraceae bacterium 62-35]